jgi:hypothetical protein
LGIGAKKLVLLSIVAVRWAGLERRACRHPAHGVGPAHDHTAVHDLTPRRLQSSSRTKTSASLRSADRRDLDPHQLDKAGRLPLGHGRSL